MKNLTVGLVLSLGLLATAASADNMNGWFIGVGANHDAVTNSNIYNNTAIIPSTGDTATVATYDGGTIGYNVFVGKQINNNLDVRFGYSQAGTSEIKFTDGGRTNSTKLKYNNNSTSLMAHYAVPVATNLSVSAIAGVVYYSSTQKLGDTTGSGIGSVPTGDQAGFNAVYGFGAGYKFNQFRVETTYLCPSNAIANEEAWVNLNFSYFL